MKTGLVGISCVHAYAALARVNKHPEDFCHKLITIESYKETYKYHINPIPGQGFWEQSQLNRPLAPSIKRKPENLQIKRRNDSDEGTSSSKKSKPVTALKNSFGLSPASIACKKVTPREDVKRKEQLMLLKLQFTEEKREPATRPTKLPARRRSPTTTPSTALDPMKSASSATASRFTNFLKFVPTPRFKHPQKK
ncbi:hypothetical protein Ahy_A05g022944 [Arachis hypogaea]|uniref:Uncharacterized protein n=1 Tax=Arachis hypogaea TaxID=3818 RepID=A0A445D225_ARAHY|nr:hypothetical protein Ahy_A05g022944 [Arachis hypogaea]